MHALDQHVTDFKAAIAALSPQRNALIAQLRQTARDLSAGADREEFFDKDGLLEFDEMGGESVYLYSFNESESQFLTGINTNGDPCFFEDDSDEFPVTAEPWARISDAELLAATAQLQACLLVG